MNRPTRNVRAWLVAVALVLAGCAQVPIFGGQGREAGSPDAFEMQGRVYVRFGERAFSGSLRWRHAVETDEVWLGGPFGQTGAHILREATEATLTTADQQTYRATSIERLTREGLGWTLPLADLSYYVLSQAPPDTASVERDAAGRPSRLERDGWSVRWIARDGAATDVRPARLELTKADVEIRLVIDQLQAQQ